MKIDIPTLIDNGGKALVAIFGAIAAVVVALTALYVARSKKKEQSVEPEPVETSTKNKPRILIVDDERSLLQAIQFALNGDFEVLALENPLDALSRAIDEYRYGKRFDAVIVDYRMEPMDGPHFIKIFRSLESGMKRRPAKIAFLSGMGQLIDKRAHNVDAVWRKPQDAARIRERIQELIKE